MKKLIAVLCSAILSVSAFGQQIKTSDIEMNDLRMLLKAAGYELYGFDMSGLLGDRYYVTFVTREYSDGKMVKEREYPIGGNKLMLSDVPEESRAEALEKWEFKDRKTQTIRQAERLVIGLYPSGADSVVQFEVRMPDMGSAGHRFNLRGLKMKWNGKMNYNYHTRPFVLGEVRAGEFTPLVLYGSAWRVGDSDITSFCGDNEIAPDLSSEIVKKIPHFYVLGIKITKQ